MQLHTQSDRPRLEPTHTHMQADAAQQAHTHSGKHTLSISSKAHAAVALSYARLSGGLTHLSSAI